MGRHCVNPHKGANNYILKIPNYKELLRETTCETMKYSPDYYNCGGFALGTFNWYRPYRYGSGLYDEINDIREQLCNENIDYYEGCSLIGERYVRYMCNQKVFVEYIIVLNLNKMSILLLLKPQIMIFIMRVDLLMVVGFIKWAATSLKNLLNAKFLMTNGGIVYVVIIRAICFYLL